MTEQTMTFWLSFCDASRPEGDQFLGAAVVDVTAAEIAAAKVEIDQRFPRHLPDAEGIAAATRKAHQLGCNPGGEVASMRLDDLPGFATISSRYPRGRLLSRAEVTSIDQAIDQQLAAAASDPHVASPGKPTQRDSASSSSSL